MRLRPDPDALIRIAVIAAVTAMVYARPIEAGDGNGAGRLASTPALAAAIAASRNIANPPLYRLASNRVAAPGIGAIGPLVRASLAFNVTVCLDDVEYSIACRERSLLEAARRLEQIFIDDYTQGRVAGSLTVVFPLAVERPEQLQFLREAENRAIAAANTKLQSELDRLTASAATAIEQSRQLAVEQSRANATDPSGANASDPSGANASEPTGANASSQAVELAMTARQAVQQLHAWHDVASMEAASGTNWLHGSTGTHQYKPGPALHQLVRIKPPVGSNPAP
jgi:hypothetical protein